MSLRIMVRETAGVGRLLPGGPLIEVRDRAQPVERIPCTFASRSVCWQMNVPSRIKTYVEYNPTAAVRRPDSSRITGPTASAYAKSLRWRHVCLEDTALSSTRPEIKHRQRKFELGKTSVRV